jgi:RND family efflux transporter MFP subunit
MNGLRFASLSLLASGLLLAGCHQNPPVPDKPPVIHGLSTSVVTQAEVPNITEGTGTVHAKEDSVLSVQTMGRVTAVFVREGDAVRAGQTLLTLDNAQAQAGVARAKASVSSYEQELKVAESDAALANSTLQRYQILRDRHSISAQEFDEVQRRSQSASARADAAQAQLNAAKADASGAGQAATYGHISAPFAGYVTARHVDPGSMAMPGLPLLEVEKSGNLQLDVNVNEVLVQSLQKGMAVDVHIAALPTPNIVGHVSELDPAADATSHSFLVKIDLPSSPGLRSGMFGTAGIGGGARSAVMVPQAAIVTHGSLNAVWVLDTNHIASLRYVTLGARNGDRMEALSGLSVEEQVVVAPQDRELGGRKIEVKP